MGRHGAVTTFAPFARPVTLSVYRQEPMVAERNVWVSQPWSRAVADRRDGERLVLGLALSGGAAHSAASAGVIEVLDAAGISADVVVGTSGGSVIGAGYAAGLSPAEISQLVGAARWDKFGQLRPGWRAAIYDPAPTYATLRRRFGDVWVEDLPRQFGALAYDMRARRSVLLTSGPLVTVLRASTAVPLLFPPAYVEGRPLGDGSIVSGLPAWAARDLGATFVIGVGFGWEEHPESWWSRTRRAALHAPDREAEVPDLLIQPAIRSYHRWRTVDLPQIIEAGRAAARAALPEIRARLDSGVGDSGVGDSEAGDSEAGDSEAAGSGGPGN